jgi:hypothetical protein
MITDLLIALTIAINYLVFSLVFPLSWKIYYARHPPKNANDELWALLYVVPSILCASVTFSGMIARPLDDALGGRYFFYSTLFGAVLAILATMALVSMRPPEGPRGLRQTLFIGWAVGWLALLVVNVTVLQGLVPSI